MAEMNLSRAVSTNLTDAYANQASVSVTATYQVASQQLDSPQDQEETIWTNVDFNKWLGYYKTIPELRSAIDTYAGWVVGKGFTTDPETTLLLDKIRGNGKEHILSILRNLEIISLISGDSYAEIIRDEDGDLINLKPLNPDSIRHIFNRKGILIRYEQFNKVKKNTIPLKFMPDEMLHLSRNRIGDEMHGNGIIQAVEKLVLARNEAIDDWKRVLHRNVDPLQIHKVDTDDQTKINNYKSLLQTARATGESLVIPKGSVEIEVVQAPLQNPLVWIEAINQYFYQSVGVPDIVTGSSKVLTEASAKIALLSYSQGIEYEQVLIEEMFRIQLNLIIDMINPVKIQSEAISSVQSEPVNQAFEPNDLIAEMEGRQ